MVRAIIVAKTHMGSTAACIGALNLETNQNIRLLGRGGAKQTVETEFDVGQIWDITFQIPTIIKPPHIEDVIVDKAEFVSLVVNMRQFLIQRIPIWRGGVEKLFDGYLTSERGSAFVSPDGLPPNTSVGFWLPDRPLKQANNPEYYTVGVNVDVFDEFGLHDEKLYIKHVGFQRAISQIPAETLLRVSLARWWQPDGANEKRCYLQLSEWYL